MFCECGCGQETTVFEGQPRRFVVNHHKLNRGPRYVEEDRGYDTPCWVWQLTRQKGGYGSIVRDGRRHLAHRFIYEELRGKIPEGLTLDHLCRVPLCVNPDHLDPVTHVVNVRRGSNATLTTSEVGTIRWLLDNTPLTQLRIAERFGVSRQTVSAIKRGQRWRITGGRAY